MNSGLTASPDFTIRSLETPQEIESDPDFQVGHLHGAFLGQVHIGSYRMHQRWLAIGSSRVRVGCIGGVVTRPEYRHRGIAGALMLDALTIARQQHFALLLLHGIADFYRQLGYIDVFEDMPHHTLERARIPEQPPDSYTVRLATADDAPAILGLYQEHYSGFTGSFAPTRTVERQAHYLQHWPEKAVPLTDGF